MTTTPAIQVAGLRKSFGDHPVLDGVTFTVPAGTVWALLGPNGAGKSTIVHILSTLIRSDGGRATVAGADVRTEPAVVRRRIGLTGQFSAVDGLLTGRQNLALVGRLHHLAATDRKRRVKELLADFSLDDAADRPVSTYSGGMKRRLDLAMTLVPEPRLIFLDEPSTGLDPRVRRDLWGQVRRLARAGTTVFLTTQYLEEAEALADRVAVLDHGRIIAEGSVAELKRQVPGASTLDDVFLSLTGRPAESTGRDGAAAPGPEVAA